LVIKRVRELGSGSHTPTQFFLGVPPPREPAEPLIADLKLASTVGMAERMFVWRLIAGNLFIAVP